MDRKTYEFISKQTNDPIVERRSCKRTGEDFAIYQSDVEMLGRLSPIIWWEKYNLNLPTLSPKAKKIRLMMYRNERKLYKRKCDKTNQDIVSIYPQDSQNVVYHHDEWFKDD